MGHAAEAGIDRLSDLDDGVIGHILSFLDAKEAGRAAALSSRFRHVLGSVHTVSLELPERPCYLHYGNSWYAVRPFVAAVTKALFFRNRRPAPAAAAVPVRTFRVSLEGYDSDDQSTVDMWVLYALSHAAPEFHLELRLGREPVRSRPRDRRKHDSDTDDDAAAAAADRVRRVKYQAVAAKPPESDSDEHPLHVRPEDEDDVASSDDVERERVVARPLNPPCHEYTVLRGIFSCAALRSLRLGYCRLSPPAAISLPSLEALHLTHVPDEQEHLQRLISACPRLADLTLEACGSVTALSLLDNPRLRRLAVRCCHKLAKLAVDAPELHSLEYRGATIPDNSFLTVRGGGVLSTVTSCRMDILEEDTSEEEELAAKLGSFLGHFASTTKHLQLCSPRMGSCFVNLPAFPALRHLELEGSMSHSDDPAIVAATMSGILGQVPNLESLALFFEVAPGSIDGHHVLVRTAHSMAELLDAHHLHYSRHDTTDYAPATVPPCLGSRVRKIELVHYQGGRAQRTLARFLLRNALLLEELYCGFAEGPEWIQRELMREMEGWVVNETTSKEFR